MRFTWTVQGDDPDWGVLARHGINGAFAPMFDGLTTKAYVKEIKERTGVAGIYLGAGWLNLKDPSALVQRVHKEYQRVFIPGLRVMFNLEEHDPGNIARVLEEWRELHPTVGTSWSMEPNQGGWMGRDVTPGGSPSSFVQRVAATKTRLVPQTFFGNMSPAGEANVMWDLAKRGFLVQTMSPFHDAAALPPDWQGYAFTAGRLPA